MACKPELRRQMRIVRHICAMLLFVVPIIAQAGQQPAAAPGANAPFNFSHKRHADTKLQCVFCHETALSAEKATLPEEQRCMVCHTAVKADSDLIRQLAEIPKDSRIAPEKPLYKLPEYVYFSHARHAGAKIECARCHGDVYSMDVVELHMPMRMKACVDCHKANGAEAKCTTCHEEIQQ